MEIILIGNYRPDNQPSMMLFADLLEQEFKQRGLKTEIWLPNVILGKGFKKTNVGLGKWVGYIDKYILFPLILRYRVWKRGLKNSATRFHICDHSNSIYLANLPKELTSITCHDVIAINAGLGLSETYHKPSFFAKYQQKWILRNLIQAEYVACVSQYTFNELKKLIGKRHSIKDGWCVILNPFNGDFKRIDTSETNAILTKVGIEPGTPFILHVGSNLERKNRKMLLEMVAEAGDRWNGYICYAGKAEVNKFVGSLAQELGLQHRVLNVIRPSHETLVALYNACEAFIFPSFSEGFGWPVIEAQACGAPVIASNFEPMPEVSGGAALHVDPFDKKAYCNALLSLKDEKLKFNLIENGYLNCQRFNTDNIINQYLQMLRLNP